MNTEIEIALAKFEEKDKAKEKYYFTIQYSFNNRIGRKTLVSHKGNKTATGASELRKSFMKLKELGADVIYILEFSSNGINAKGSEYPYNEEEIILNDKATLGSVDSPFGNIETYVKAQVTLGQLETEKRTMTDTNSRLSDENNKLKAKTDEQTNAIADLRERLREKESAIKDLERSNLDEIRNIKDELGLRNLISGWGLNFVANKTGMKADDVLGMIGVQLPKSEERKELAQPQQPAQPQKEVDFEQVQESSELSKEKQKLLKVAKKINEWIVYNIENNEDDSAKALIQRVVGIFSYFSKDVEKLEELYNYIESKKTKENGNESTEKV